MSDGLYLLDAEVGGLAFKYLPRVYYCVGSVFKELFFSVSQDFELSGVELHIVCCLPVVNIVEILLESDVIFLF